MHFLLHFKASVVAGRQQAEGFASRLNLIAVERGRDLAPAAAVDAGHAGDVRELAALHPRLALDVLQRRAFESIGQVSANALVTRFPARAALFLNRLAGLRVGVVVLANLAELDFGENLQVAVPDGSRRAFRHDQWCGPAAHG